MRCSFKRDSMAFRHCVGPSKTTYYCYSTKILNYHHSHMHTYVFCFTKNIKQIDPIIIVVGQASAVLLLRS